MNRLPPSEAKPKLCIGCRKPMPPRATSKGWQVVRCTSRGRGSRWYRQCGCLGRTRFNELVDLCFDTHRDYPWEHTDMILTAGGWKEAADAT